VTLLAFAAERRAAAQLLLGTRQPPLAIYPARTALCSKLQIRRALRLRLNDWTDRDGRTDARSFHRHCSAV